MAEISDLDELSGDLPSEAEIEAIIRTIDITIMNIIRGKGTFGSVDYQEHGSLGFEIKPSTTLKQLKDLREMYVNVLNDPTQFDIELQITQYDNPGL